MSNGLNEKYHLSILPEEAFLEYEEIIKQELTQASILPTGKPHISYSEFAEHEKCNYRHKLIHIDKLSTWEDNIHALFGTQLHSACEELVETGIVKDKSKYINAYRVKAEEILENLKNNAINLAAALVEATDSEIEELTKQAEKAQEKFDREVKNHNTFIEKFPVMIDDVLPFLSREYPGWRLEKSEMKLYMQISDKTKHYFKGFIDLVISIPRQRQIAKRKGSLRLSELKKQLNLPIEHMEPSSAENKDREIILLDWKKTNEGWSNYDRGSFTKQAQLLLYKHFFCKITGFDPEKVNCGFVMLKAMPRELEEKTCELIKVDASNENVEKAYKKVVSMIGKMKKGIFTKNKTEFNCRFCEFNGTEHCP